MNFYRSLFISIGILIVPFLTIQAQTNKEYYSTEGFSINAYHYNIYDGNSPRSFSFMKNDSACGSEIAVLYHNEYGHQYNLRSNGEQIWIINKYNCQEILLYDFGIGVGDIIQEGIYKGIVLLDKYEVELLNGEKSNRYDFKHKNNSGWKMSWIEGIGDITNGLIPQFGDFEGYDKFVCAKVNDELLWENDRDTAICSNHSCAKPYVLIDTYIDSFTLNTSITSYFTDNLVLGFGDGSGSNLGNTEHTYGQAGCYNLTITATNDCGQQSQEVRTIPICIDNPWKIDYSFDTLRSLSIHVYNDSLQFALSGPYVFRTVNGGRTWQKLTCLSIEMEIGGMR